MEQLTSGIVQFGVSGFPTRLKTKAGTEEFRILFPRMPFFCGDEMELAAAVANQFTGGCNRPCSMCEICPWERYDDGTYKGLKGTGPKRDNSVFKLWFDSTTRLSTMPEDWSKYLSIHPEYNSMFHVPGLNPFWNPPCRMHSLDHGVFVRILELTVDLLKARGKNGALKRFNRRWLHVQVLQSLAPDAVACDVY